MGTVTGTFTRLMLPTNGGNRPFVVAAIPLSFRNELFDLGMLEGRAKCCRPSESVRQASYRENSV